MKKKKDKSYYVGLFALFLMAVLYMIMYPHFKDIGNANESAIESTESVSMESVSMESVSTETVFYNFRYPDRLTGHFEKHGAEMGFSTEEEYLEAANALINNPDCLRKTEAEDGDQIYFLESTNEIAFVSTDGYLRTYFICSGIDYYNRQ